LGAAAIAAAFSTASREPSPWSADVSTTSQQAPHPASLRFNDVAVFPDDVDHIDGDDRRDAELNELRLR
jgi:hypothetical protein